MHQLQELSENSN